MNRQMLVATALLALSISAKGQGPTDYNEGSTLTYNSAANTYNFSWWGRAGKSYFVQKTDDLLTSWYYFPVVLTGADAALSLGFEAPNSDKLFLRLEVLDYNPHTFDTDGDGMPDAYEVLNYLNPKVADGTLDLDGDSIPNREDARPNDAAIGRLSISITSPMNGAILP